MTISADHSRGPTAVIDDGLIELEPTMQMELAGESGSRISAGVGLVAGSLAGEINVLRRRRLGAAALFLAVACGGAVSLVCIHRE